MNKAEYERRRNALIERYPYMFAGKTVGIQSAPRTERLSYAIAIEPGWFEIVENLCSEIDALVPPDLRRADGRGFHVRQIKEKFGTLRFYWDVGTGPHEPMRVDILTPQGLFGSFQSSRAGREAWRKEFDKLVAATALQSGQTCFVCGSTGRTRESAGWLNTSCDRHEGFRDPFDP